MQNLRRILSQLKGVNPNWPPALIAFALKSKRTPTKSIAFTHESLHILEEIHDTLLSLNLKSLLFSTESPISPVDIFLVPLNLKEDFEDAVKRVSFTKVVPGKEIDFEKFKRGLVDAGFQRVNFVEKYGEFSVRGGIIDIFLPGVSCPIRIEFFGDTIESIRRFDIQSQRSIEKIDEIVLPFIGEGPTIEYVPHDSDTELQVEPNPPYLGQWNLFKNDLLKLKESGYQVLLFTLNKNAFTAYEDLFGVETYMGRFTKGFRLPQLKMAFFCEHEVKVGRIPRTDEVIVPGARIEDISSLQVGDLVVYSEYGIGRFEGLKTIKKNGVTFDTVVIRYKDGVVRIPVMNLDRIHKFVHHGNIKPSLSSLSSGYWARQKKILEEVTWGLAKEILNQYAIRQLKRGFAFPPSDSDMYELEAMFPYELTPDQSKAIEDVKRDMESPHIMDRLVAGDVGFGKTEVALRAAFKAVLAGKQVIFLVPTTVLALQHYENFTKWLEKFPVIVKMLSRLTPKSEQLEILDGLKRGTVDIVIGTHRLLQDDVVFKDPGLLIIDEEHRFGVLQKEKIRAKYSNIDVLRLTATPIPRTLYAALGKLYALSVIETPPIGRKPVKTIVTRYDQEIVKNAILHEIERGGQVFYLHNRISNLPHIKERLKQLVPGIRIGIAHGRMSPSKLEDIFLKFYRGEIDILLSTSIIESGLDFPRANTLIVENAHTFGLAELHQLRGRVGRSTVQAYAYFFVPKRMKNRATDRMRAIQMYQHLGAGLRIAMADLEIRGAGNLLGVEQHGHAKRVGYEIFYHLLDRAIRTLAGEHIKDDTIEVVANSSAYIPDDYIEEPWVRIAYYRKLANASSYNEIDVVEEELTDRFGIPPYPAKAFIDLHRIRVWAITRGYKRVIVSEDRVEVEVKTGKSVSFRKSLVLTWIKNSKLQDEAKVN